jgi:SAM-dependent methyltransferase
MDVVDRQSIEIEYWRNASDESPETDSVANVINKVGDAPVFLSCLQPYYKGQADGQRILELGGGQGWASCLLKRLYPSVHVTTTDISPYAIMSVPKWERLWQTKIDNAYACKCYETREADDSIDLVFCFAAAHHFAKHDATLKEIQRILRPGGRALYLYEPSTPRALHPLAHWRVNRKRPSVPEDVLITARILELAKANGLTAKVDYFPALQKRAPFETLYYFALGRVPLLQRLLPCTANFVFSKPARSG